MKAVILAGGKGTRLGERTKDLPKPMIPVAGKPLVQYQVELCAAYGLEEIIFIVNHLKQPIIDHFGDGSAFGIPIRYFEEEYPMGTVGGIKAIEKDLKDDFLVLYGDVMMEMDLSKLLSFHSEKQSEATLVVHPNDHPYDSDLVELDDEERVVAILPKPHPGDLWYHNMVNAAAYVFKPSILDHLEEGVKADFGKDIFPRLFTEVRMFGYNTSEYLKDMGTPDRLEQVEKDVLSGKVKRRSLAVKQKAIFLDRDGVINPDKDLIHKVEDMELYPFTNAAIKKINSSDYLSVVTTNQSVVARNLTTIEGLQGIHKKMETLMGNEGAKLDAIYYCPHHPDKGYPGENPLYKIVCDCRKPKPGMIVKASAKFNIDPTQSYMIGDSERDIQSGIAAGCTTIGVRTGHGLRDSKTQPDYIFSNLMEAVDFMIDDPLQEPFEQIHNRITASDKPFVISIAGNSRSGKSSLTTYLQKGLEKQGKRVSVIPLDHWVRPKEEREPEIDVFHNFNFPKLESEVERLLKGETIELNAYMHHTSWGRPKASLNIGDAEIIIIDGIVSIASERMRRLSNLKVFRVINEELLKERTFGFYRWKGYEDAEIEKIWNHRKPNEYDIIAEHVNHADIVIR